MLVAVGKHTTRPWPLAHWHWLLCCLAACTPTRQRITQDPKNLCVINSNHITQTEAFYCQPVPIVNNKNAMTWTRWERCYHAMIHVSFLLSLFVHAAGKRQKKHCRESMANRPSARTISYSILFSQANNIRAQINDDSLSMPVDKDRAPRLSLPCTWLRKVGRWCSI